MSMMIVMNVGVLMLDFLMRVFKEEGI